MYTTPTRPNELYHHGVLGMHWGIRRYQPYPDGSKRKGKEVGQAAKKPQSHNTSNQSHSFSSSNSNPQPKQSQSKAKAYIKKKLLYAGDKLVDSLINKGTNYAAEKIMKKLFDDYNGGGKKKKNKEN